MNQVDTLSVGLIPSNEIASAGGGTISLWPILGLIVVAGTVILIVYKKFFE